MSEKDIEKLREELNKSIEEFISKNGAQSIDNLQLLDLRAQNELILNQLRTINYNLEGLMNKILR
jgi:hypothetical protein